MKPSVSVLVCTYGEDRWRVLAAQRAIPSAQRQGAVEVVAYHYPEGTLADCRNTAGAAATGDYLCFLDADDELAPGYVAAMRETAAQERQEALYYPAVQYCRAGREDKPTLLGGGRPLIDLNRAVIGTLVPRRLFLELGGFGEEPIYEDWALWLRCSEHVPLVPVEAAVYRVNVRSASRNSAVQKLGRVWYDIIRERHGVVRLGG